MDSPARDRSCQCAYHTLIRRWGEAAFYRRLISMTHARAMDYGVSARTGWLTDRGIEVYAAINGLNVLDDPPA